MSGKNLIKMDALKSLYSGLGFVNVTTYIQRGNVVFQSELYDTATVGQLISDGILNLFQLRVPVLIREYNELKTILKANPFLNGGGEDISKLHITFLSELPDESRVQSILNDAYQSDEFSVIGKTVYLWCPNGYGNTKLSNSFFEYRLRVTATTRNLRTLNELERIGGMTEHGAIDPAKFRKDLWTRKSKSEFYFSKL